MKKRLLIFECFFLVLSFVVIKNTYGLFEQESYGKVDIPIASWVIKVDGKDLKLDKELNYSDFTITTNGHSDDAYFAPGTTASYVLNIDTSASDVAISYKITVDTSSLNEHPNIKLKVIDLDGTSISSDDNTFSGIIKLDDLAKIRHLQINLEWVDDPAYDAQDSDLIDSELPIKLSAQFSQYLGE